MKNLLVMSLVAFVSFVVACAPPAENAERTAACKEAGNAKMCGVCCKTQKSNFTSTGMTGTCACLGDLEK